jgi:hypothetical protein
MNAPAITMSSRKDGALQTTFESRRNAPATAAKAGPLWRHTTMVRNRQGHEEAFTVGPDGCVWSFFPGAAGQQGPSAPSLVNLGMQADLLTVGRDNRGCLVVFAAKGLSIQYRVESDELHAGMNTPTQLRWSNIQDAALPQIHGAKSIQRIYTQEDFGTMRVAAIVALDRPGDSQAYAMVYCFWKEQGENAFWTAPSLWESPKTGAQST